MVWEFDTVQFDSILRFDRYLFITQDFFSDHLEIQESKQNDRQRRFSRSLGLGQESKPRQEGKKGINRKIKMEIKNEIRMVLGSLTQVFCAKEERLCFGGPKGEKGDVGIEGIPGVRGEKGVAGPTGPKGDKGQLTYFNTRNLLLYAFKFHLWVQYNNEDDNGNLMMIMIVSVHRITLLETSMHVEINTRLFNNWAPYSCVKAAKRI